MFETMEPYWIFFTFSRTRDFWKPYKYVKSLPKPGAWGLHRFPKDTSEPSISALAVPVQSFSQDDGGLSCNYYYLHILYIILFMSYNCSDLALLVSQDIPVQKQSDHVQDFYQSFAEHFNGECSSVLAFLSRDYMDDLTWFLICCVFLFLGLPEPQIMQIMEHLEKLIMTQLHKWVFCHDSCDDEQKDLTLQRRIRWALNKNYCVWWKPPTSWHHLTLMSWCLQLVKLGHSADVECSFSWWKRHKCDKRPVSASHNRWFTPLVPEGRVVHCGKCA